MLFTSRPLFEKFNKKEVQTEAITDPDFPTLEEQETSLKCVGPILVPYGMRKYNHIEMPDPSRDRRDREKCFPKIVWMEVRENAKK